jgi:hypothetical protein
MKSVAYPDCGLTSILALAVVAMANMAIPPRPASADTSGPLVREAALNGSMGVIFSGERVNWIATPAPRRGAVQIPNTRISGRCRHRHRQNGH